ncbi:VpsD family glycosyltransferase [Pseudoalteromonas sp. APC 3358]|uniref:VpsD family glycosyltransferase n=1 Tax=Pseudoalteromonas sp. APC 3358 TaxID=3035176 RepID=UPI0025B4498E|nr:VpsD family glycosyltransferase [Pseudoalteromonas sp. APC 3358]MDN3384684.1 VpsD family glycosyltransferase [Pseudoalteromonas sp. APC 3358]
MISEKNCYKIMLIMPMSTLNFGSESTGGVDSVCQLLLKGFLEINDPRFTYNILMFDPSNRVEINGMVIKLNENISVTLFNVNNGSFLPNIITIYRNIKDQISILKPDLVHSHLMAWGVNFSIKSKSVITIHGYKKIARKSRSFLNNIIYEDLIPFLANKMDNNYTCVSNNLKNVIKNEFNKDLEVIYNPIIEDYFSTNSERMSTVSTGTLKLTTCGLLTQRKGIHHIIKVMEILKNKGVKASLTIIGPITDHVYFNKLKKMIKEAKFTDDILFKGKLETKDIKKLYLNSDIGIFLSEEETFGLVPIEMLSTGLPTIASKTGVIEDFFSSKQTIKNLSIVNYDDYDGIAQIACGHAKFGKRPTSEDCVDVKDLFSKKVICESYNDYYIRIIKDD